MYYTRQVIINQYFINAGFIWNLFYEIRKFGLSTPGFSPNWGVINDLQRQDICIQLALTHVFYTLTWKYNV